TEQCSLKSTSEFDAGERRFHHPPAQITCTASLGLFALPREWSLRLGINRIDRDPRSVLLWALYMVYSSLFRPWTELMPLFQLPRGMLPLCRRTLGGERHRFV
ncbi:unnamed protein product, partial [Ascophyllum nodosum]